MENNRIDDTNESRWIDEELARLDPSLTWEPDTNRAYRRFLQRHEQRMPRRGRLLLTAALSSTVLVVLLLLPWQFMLHSMTQKESVPVQPRPLEATPDAAKSQGPQRGFESVGVTSPVNGQILEGPSAVLRPSPAGQLRAAEVRPAEGPRLPTVPPAQAPVEGRTEGLGFQAHELAPSAVGGDVTAPKAIYRVQPEYTEEARAARATGSVQVLCVVKEDGTAEVRGFNQKKKLGFGLDEAAAAAVAQWRFEPGTRNGNPVPVFISIEVNFTLR